MCSHGFKCESKRCVPNFEKVYGPWPLLGAAKDGNVKVVSGLISDPQTDVNQQDARGRSPLFQAVRNGHVEVAKYLI